MEPQHPATPAQHPATLGAGDLVNDVEAAAILGISLQTLRNWRWRGEGPRYCKLGKRLVRYRRSDIADFINGTERVA